MQSSLEQIYKPFLLVVRTQKDLVWKKIINMCHLKGLFRIQAFLFFYNYDYIQLLGCSVPKFCTNLSFVRMDYLLKHTPDNSLACIKKVRITDSS